jgi:hypothetical protein
LNVVEFEFSGWFGRHDKIRFVSHARVPLAQAQAAIRQPSVSLRSANVKWAPVCVTCCSLTLKVMVAGTTMYALWPVVLLCNGSPSVTK